VRPLSRGGPAEFTLRRERALQLRGTTQVDQPLAVLAAVLDHQQARARDATVLAAAALVRAGADERAKARIYPLLDATVVAESVESGIGPAVRALTSGDVNLPEPLVAAGQRLEAPLARADAVGFWLSDPSLIDAPLGFWISIAAAPIFEVAAVGAQVPGPQQWTAAICPVCGGAPQVSVIAEESGEFMAGSPRSLICGRCASRWGFRRATCVACGEDDSRRIGGWTADAWPVIRIEACDTCRSYIKTFDLRQPGGRDVVPLVDDVASVALDLWANDQGLQRPVRSLAGV
jgi:formate dehydrogenase maturation protein FdhE